MSNEVLTKNPVQQIDECMNSFFPEQNILFRISKGAACLKKCDFLWGSQWGKDLQELVNYN